LSTTLLTSPSTTTESSATRTRTRRPSAADAAGLFFEPRQLQRVMDTRNGAGPILGPLGPDRSVPLHLPGVDGQDAAVLNVTVTNPTADSFLTVYSGDGSSLPAVSNLNFRAGQTVSNLVIVPQGTVSLYNHAGNANVIVDLLGQYVKPP
jgi:hypothetical protein